MRYAIRESAMFAVCDLTQEKGSHSVVAALPTGLQLFFPSALSHLKTHISKIRKSGHSFHTLGRTPNKSVGGRFNFASMGADGWKRPHMRSLAALSGFDRLESPRHPRHSESFRPNGDSEQMSSFSRRFVYQPPLSAEETRGRENMV